MKYEVWDYDETDGIDKGRRIDHFPHHSNHRTMAGAARFFMGVTRWPATSLTPSGDLEHTEFYHRTLGYVGGISLI